jgi:hypothetical protein
MEWEHEIKVVRGKAFGRVREWCCHPKGTKDDPVELRVGLAYHHHTARPAYQSR